MAEAQAERLAKTPTEVFRAIQSGRFTQNLETGQVIVSVSEAGGTVSMQFPRGMDPLGLIELSQECIESIEDTRPRIRRLRASFRHAVV